MFQPASVSVSGPALSFLFYETCKATFRQDGFLLGEIVHKQTTCITDNDQQQVDVSKVIKINSVVPFPPGNNYFLRGRVDKERLRKFLGSNFSKVVAWYKFQPLSGFDFTLKDRAIHKQLRELFDIPYDLFSCCFLSMECTDNLSSYSYSQSFIRYFNGHFERLHLSIPNLSESNNTYKNSEPASPVFSKILSGLKVNIENSKGIVAVTEIENAVQKYINSTVSELSKAEKILFELEEEVKLLKSGCPKINENKSDNCVDTENSSQNRVKMENYEEAEDLISFADDPPSHLSQDSTSIDEEMAQEVSKVVKTRGRIKKRSEESEIEVNADGDSNRRDSDVFRDSNSRSPEIQQKCTTSKGRATRSRSKKKN